ncbi:hypothetical protein AAG570_005626 [Ranatra chinensis]|uniref:Uncharacterized protein n=1 Tax=Ranatra chinensis TaxID=642074 RepID=A0ABD0XY26_9HEMI
MGGKKKSAVTKGDRAAASRWRLERASDYRIQRLLFTEYSDLEDIVLIESPFAQTTRDGIGIRQIQMGLYQICSLIVTIFPIILPPIVCCMISILGWVLIIFSIDKHYR